MELQKVFVKLDFFKNQLEKQLKEIGELDFNKSSIEERFLFEHIDTIICNMYYLVEDICYIKKEIYKKGNINIENGKIYIDDFLIKGGDKIECLINQEWETIEIFKIQNEFYCEYLKSTLEKNNNILLGRIRLSQNELNNR